MDKPLKEVISHFGSKYALAKALGICHQAISQWDKIPIDRTFEIEEATGGKFKHDDLRPDIFRRKGRAR